MEPNQSLQTKIVKQKLHFFYPIEKYFFLQYDMKEIVDHDTENVIEVFFKFGDNKTGIKEFHCSKEVTNVGDVTIEKILVSGEFAYNKNKETNAKYFKGYKTDKIRPLLIELPQ